jgi:hypothetical protein
MDFIVGLPRTQKGYDSIWVIVDRLTKVTHFVLVKTTYTGPQLAELYISRIVCLHGVPKKIVSDRGTSSLQSFGNGYMSRWIPSLILPQPIIPKRMDKWSELIKY